MRKKALKNAVRRALRGGSFNDVTWILSSSFRNGYVPEVRYGEIRLSLGSEESKMRKKALKNAVRRVIRGGSYDDGVSWDLRSTNWYRDGPMNRRRYSGFRLIARSKK